MSKSAIYTVNSSTQSVEVNGDINLGTIQRRFGPNFSLSGNAIRITGAGYYNIDSSFTVLPTAIGTVTITAYKDGVAVPGMVASAAAATANTPVNLSLVGVIRENCPCCDDSSNLSFVLTGTASNVSNAAVVIEKL